MRECENVDVRDVLPDYLGGAMDAAGRARVESHLDGCEPCRAELALLRDVRALRRPPAVDVSRIVAALPRPAGAAAQASADVVSLDAHRARRRGGAAGFQWRRAAGIVAVLFAGGVTWGVTQRTPDVIAPVPGESATTRAPEGGQPVRPVTPDVSTPTPPVPTPPRPAPRVDVAALGSLGGVASDASDEELDALIAALDDISGVPDVESEEAAQEGGA